MLHVKKQPVEKETFPMFVLGITLTQKDIGTSFGLKEVSF